MTTLLSSAGYKEVALPQGSIRYYDQGSGPVLVFIHGVFVNSALWRNVIPRLTQRFRCIVPDLPLGAHSLPMHADANLSPGGLAQLVADFLAALNLQDVTLVGNDTGGAICQLTIAAHPERITRLVLTNCDAFENFFPPFFSFLHYGPRFFGEGFTRFLARILRSRVAQRGLVATVAYHRIEDDVLDAVFGSFLHNEGVQRDVTKVLQGISNRYTLEASRAFGSFQHPVLLVWGKNDPFFSARFAVRLQQAFPSATLEFVSHSRAFVPEDQPELLAQRIMEFVHEPVHS
ncbi:MAG: alpha/beta hydrolase [Ktedonobacteraceae bacterium]|nr:alpha/beta hydrolase [Ktedonobacteraceae bacterium]